MSKTSNITWPPRPICYSPSPVLGEEDLGFPHSYLGFFHVTGISLFAVGLDMLALWWEQKNLDESWAGMQYERACDEGNAGMI